MPDLRRIAVLGAGKMGSALIGGILKAGVAPASCERFVGRRIPVFRAMPNIPVIVEEGATAVCLNSVAEDGDREFIESIFRAVGVCCFVEEEMMDAVTALSGSGPAYVYTVIEALGLKMDLSRETSARLAEKSGAEDLKSRPQT